MGTNSSIQLRADMSSRESLNIAKMEVLITKLVMKSL